MAPLRMLFLCLTAAVALSAAACSSSGAVPTTTLLVTTTLGPIDGPFDSAELNTALANFEARVRAAGKPIDITRDLFDTELMGNYELGYHALHRNLEVAIRRGQGRELMISQLSLRLDPRGLDEFWIPVRGEVGTEMSMSSAEIRDNGYIAISGSIDITGLDNEGRAVSEGYALMFSNGTVLGWRARPGNELISEGYGICTMGFEGEPGRPETLRMPVCESSAFYWAGS